MDEMKRKNAIERTIWELGGKRALSKQLGVHTNTLRHWEVNDRVPAKWQSTLLDIAKQSGIELTAEDLIGG